MLTEERALTGRATGRPIYGEVVTLRVGCPMWAHRAWIGRSLPASTAPAEMLRAYASICSAVEGNTTFYGAPRPATVARWAEQTPAGFRFMFKLPRAITHDQRLRGPATDVDAFCRLLDPLADRLGPTSVQLPASFGPEQVDILGAFLRRLPTDRRWAVEVRHPRFADGGPTERALNDLLAGAGRRPHRAGQPVPVRGTLHHRRGGRRVPAKPRLAVRAMALGHHPVVRFVGQNEADANPPFWARWVATVARWLEAGREPFFFVHTPDNLAAPDLARRFEAEVNALIASPSGASAPHR